MAEAVGMGAQSATAVPLSTADLAATLAQLADPTAMRATVTTLLATYQAQLAERDATIAALTQQVQKIAALEQQVQWLQAQFRLAQQRRFGASSEQTTGTVPFRVDDFVVSLCHGCVG